MGNRVYRLTVGLILGAPVTAFLTCPDVTAATTYYINNASGSRCSDTGLGTTTAVPWCSFTPVNILGVLEPGDKVLLARGAVWNQQLTLTGQGTPLRPIELGAYGVGARPIISRNGAPEDRAIRIDNGSFWVIHDLELSHAGAGLLMYYTTKLNYSVHIDSIYVHHITGIHQGNYFKSDQQGAVDGIWNSYGIGFTGKVPNDLGPSEYMLTNVTVSNIEGTHNQSSISFDWFNGSRVVGSGGGSNNVNNIRMYNLYLHDDDGGGRSAGCDEGMRIVAASSVVMSDSRLVNEGSCYSSTGTAALLIARVKNVIVENSVFNVVPQTGSSDQVAIDYENREDTTIIRDNVFANVAGSAISYLNIHPGDFNRGATSSGNTFINNGASHNQTGSAGSSPSGFLTDNLYHDQRSFMRSGEFSGFALSNNRMAASATELFPASLGFSPIQEKNSWRYQYYNGSSWANLSYYDALKEAWKYSSKRNAPRVTRFIMYSGVGPTVSVARTWSAPHAGVVSIRGLVLKAADSLGGGGISARIEYNGVLIWPASHSQTGGSSDQSRYSSRVDGLTVAAGGTIRFIVMPKLNVANAVVSWSPSIGYTSLGSEDSSRTQ